MSVCSVVDYYWISTTLLKYSRSSKLRRVTIITAHKANYDVQVSAHGNYHEEIASGTTARGAARHGAVLIACAVIPARQRAGAVLQYGRHGNWFWPQVAAAINGHGFFSKVILINEDFLYAWMHVISSLGW